MDLDVTVKSGDCYRLYVNGRLVCEGVGEVFQDPAALQDELTRARAACAAMRFVTQFVAALRDPAGVFDHVHKTPDARRAAFLRGALDGLDGVAQPHPGNPTLPIRPEHTASYERGYDLGCALARAEAIATASREAAHA